MGRPSFAHGRSPVEQQIITKNGSMGVIPINHFGTSWNRSPFGRGATCGTTAPLINWPKSMTDREYQRLRAKEIAAYETTMGRLKASHQKRLDALDIVRKMSRKDQRARSMAS